MRISEIEKSTIIQESRKNFGEDTEVFLFGSRVNDYAKGGDIDLLIVPANESTIEDLYLHKILLAVGVYDAVMEKELK